MIEVLGGGPAGLSAALAAQQEGEGCALMEKSRLPRHRVCGEFISPEIVPSLDRLGVLAVFEAARPARIRRMVLRFGGRQASASLPEPAYGLSRYTFDALLFRHVQTAREPRARVRVDARGRTGSAPRGRRLFGFKAHFTGPAEDAIELFFGRDWYVGVNCVEDGITNVCGLAPEDVLAGFGFDPAALLASDPALRERVSPLARSLDWLHTGPLLFGQRFDAPAPGVYLAGDALSFVDPFTGTGIAAAVITGELAGRHATRSVPVGDHIAACRRVLARPFAISSALRAVIATPWAERLVRFVPGSWLYRMTRPRVA